VEGDDLGATFETGLFANDAEWVLPVPFEGKSVWRGRREYVEFIRAWTGEFEDYSIQFEPLIEAKGPRYEGPWLVEVSSRQLAERARTAVKAIVSVHQEASAQRARKLSIASPPSSPEPISSSRSSTIVCLQYSAQGEPPW
jgi:hypothetical protein